MCIHLTHGHTDALAYILPTCLHADLQTFLPYVLETFMQACIHTWIHRCIQVYILRNRHFYVPHAVIPSLFSLDTHTWTSRRPTFLHSYTPTCMHIAQLQSCICQHACRRMHLDMYILADTSTCMLAHMHAYLPSDARSCTHTQMCMHTDWHSHTAHACNMLA